jgi:hypothetical protein
VVSVVGNLEFRISERWSQSENTFYILCSYGDAGPLLPPFGPYASSEDAEAACAEIEQILTLGGDL